MTNHPISPEFVASKFGISVSTLKSLLGNRVWPALSYRILEPAERDEVIRDLRKTIDSSTLRVSGSNDNAVWERGWGEIRDAIKAHGFNPALLRPQYANRHRIMRFDGNFIDGADADFNYTYDQLLRRICFAYYLKNASKVIELGCGTGTSQLLLAELLPDAELIASDWAKPSQELIRIMSAHLHRAIKPVCFNMLTLEGWDALSVDRGSCVLTVHALEQLGSHFETLLTKLLEAKPRFCLHLEPIIELYDENNPFDQIAIQYHKRRNYLSGWLTRLRELAKEGKAEIMDVRRLGFGGREHEAFSVIQWRAL